MTPELCWASRSLRAGWARASRVQMQGVHPAHTQGSFPRLTQHLSLLPGLTPSSRHPGPWLTPGAWTTVPPSGQRSVSSSPPPSSRCHPGLGMPERTHAHVSHTHVHTHAHAHTASGGSLGGYFSHICSGSAAGAPPAALPSHQPLSAAEGPGSVRSEGLAQVSPREAGPVTSSRPPLHIS